MLVSDYNGAVYGTKKFHVKKLMGVAIFTYLQGMVCAVQELIIKRKNVVWYLKEVWRSEFTIITNATNMLGLSCDGLVHHL